MDRAARLMNRAARLPNRAARLTNRAARLPKEEPGRGANSRALGGSRAGGRYIFARCAAWDCIRLAGRATAANRPWAQRFQLTKMSCERHQLAIPAHRYCTRKGATPTPLELVVAEARSKNTDGIAFFCEPCKARLQPGRKPSITDAKTNRAKKKKPRALSAGAKGRNVAPCRGRRRTAIVATPSPQPQPAPGPSTPRQDIANPSPQSQPAPAPPRLTVADPEKVDDLLEFGESSEEEDTWDAVLDRADLPPEFGARGSRNQYDPESQRAFRVGRPSSSKAPDGTDRRVAWEPGVARSDVKDGSMAGSISDVWLSDVVAGNACRAPGCPGFTSAEVKVQMGPSFARRISAQCSIPACSQQVVHECGGALNAPPPSKASGFDASFFASTLEAAATWQSILSQSDATTLRSSQAAAGLDPKLQTPPAATKMLMERGAYGFIYKSLCSFGAPLASFINV